MNDTLESVQWRDSSRTCHNLGFGKVESKRSLDTGLRMSPLCLLGLLYKFCMSTISCLLEYSTTKYSDLCRPLLSWLIPTWRYRRSGSITVSPLSYLFPVPKKGRSFIKSHIRELLLIIILTMKVSWLYKNNYSSINPHSRYRLDKRPPMKETEFGTGVRPSEPSYNVFL